MEYMKERDLFRDVDLFPFKIEIQGGENRKIYSYPHWHAHMELIYIIEGILELYINGQKVILKKLDIAYIGGNTVHSTYSDGSSNCSAFILYFDARLIGTVSASAIESKYLTSFLNTFGANYFKIMKGENCKTKLGEIIEGIYREYRANEDACELFIKGYLYQMISCLIREKCILVMEKEYNTEHLLIVEKSIKYIEKNYQNNISLEMLAKECNVSYFYFSKIFKSIIGKNYKEYLDHVRIAQAEKYLLDTANSIAEIANLVGIPDQGAFYRVYKRIRGYPPSEFKKNVSKNKMI